MMNTRKEIDVYRDGRYVVRLPAVSGVTCDVCGSGEVTQPPQTLNMPMWQRCLRCGHRQTST